MKTDQSNVLEKIKKLLRMKRGGTPEEVATALRLAQELAAKHNIDIQSVDPDSDDHPDRQPITQIDAVESARIQWECKYAGLIIENYFNVSVFTRRHWKRKLTFVGTVSDLTIATHVFRFLVAHFRRQWNHHSGRCRNRQAFLYGMYVGLNSKLRESKQAKSKIEPENPLAVQLSIRSLERREDYISDHFGEMKSGSVKPKGKADASLNQGFVAGRNTEIYKAMTTTPSAALRLPSAS